jgi:hypothetical protein
MVSYHQTMKIAIGFSVPFLDVVQDSLIEMPAMRAHYMLCLAFCSSRFWTFIFHWKFELLSMLPALSTNNKVYRFLYFCWMFLSHLCHLLAKGPCIATGFKIDNWMT